MTSARSTLSLWSIFVDKGPAMTLWAVQRENVGGEEVRLALKEIDFREKFVDFHIPMGIFKGVF